jgi:PAS domain S-box-containing protein
MPPEINEAQLRLAATVASSDDAIISEDLTGTITSWNPAAERIFGYTEAEAIGRSILMTVPPELQEEEDAILQRVGAGEVIDHYETVRLRKNGQRVEVSLTVSPIRTPDGRIIGASKIARDLSRTQRIQRDALRLAAIVDSSDDAILSKDMNGIVMSWNPAAEAMFGFSASEMVGQPIRFIIPDDRQEEEADVLSRIRRGDRVDHYETIRRRKDGTLSPSRWPSRRFGARAGLWSARRRSPVTSPGESERRTSGNACYRSRGSRAG